MKKSLRFITLILAAIFLISGTMMVVCYAAPDEGGDVSVEVQDPVDLEDTGDSDAAADDEGQAAEGDQGGDDQAADDNQADDEQSDNNDQAADDNQTGDNNQSGEAEQSPADDAQADDNKQQDAAAENDQSDEEGQQGGEDEGSDEDYNNYVEYDDEPLYYGDASNYDYNIPEGDEGEAKSVSSQTSLYNTSGMSEKDAVPNQWSDIKLDEKTVKTGVADFSSIKSNTGTNDNGNWILYLGYVLIGLSVLGIIYFIIATVNQRKAAKTAEIRDRRRDGSPAHSEAARMAEKERRASGTQQKNSRFADEATGYSRRASSKADTGEIYIPRRAAKK